jgi:hypothetical protein
MPTIGTDCQLILDGTGYFIEPTSYAVARPRVRRADLTGVVANPVSPGSGAGERYVDRGPGKRLFTFTVVAFSAMLDYSGSPVPLTSTQYHDALQTSYNRVNTTLSYTDPATHTWTVRFDDLSEQLVDIRSQADTLQWYMAVTLVEA